MRHGPRGGPMAERCIGPSGRKRTGSMARGAAAEVESMTDPLETSESSCGGEGCGRGGNQLRKKPGGALCRLPSAVNVAARDERGRERPPSLARHPTQSSVQGGRSRPRRLTREFRNDWTRFFRAAWHSRGFRRAARVPIPSGGFTVKRRVTRWPAGRSVLFRMEESWR